MEIESIGRRVPGWRAAQTPPMSRAALQRALKAHGMSLSVSTLRRIERGQTPVSPRLLWALLAIFSLTIGLDASVFGDRPLLLDEKATAPAARQTSDRR